MANSESDNEHKGDPPLPYILNNLFPSAFTFLLGIIMAVITIAVIIVRAAEVLSAGYNAYNLYHLGILPATRDIAAFIPVVSLFIALTLSIRRFGSTMARFIQEMTEKVRARNIAKGVKIGKAEGRAEERAYWVAWNNRRLQAEEQGEPFDEPFPIYEDTEEA